MDIRAGGDGQAGGIREGLTMALELECIDRVCKLASE